MGKRAATASVVTSVRSLVALGYLAHSHGLYRLGPRSFRLAADMLAVRRFPTLVRPVLQDLHARTQETVFLVQLDEVARVLADESHDFLGEDLVQV